MVTNEEVGRRIRLAREELRLSQAELGRLMIKQRTHAAISDIERGKTKLDVEELSELATLLKRDLAFFYGEQPPRSVVYRRSELGMTPDQQRAADQSIEAFKRLAREQARRQPER